VADAFPLLLPDASVTWISCAATEAVAVKVWSPGLLQVALNDTVCVLAWEAARASAVNVFVRPVM
jgi:hypothetical protein